MSRRTMARPRPRLPPVTITLRRTGQLARGSHLERGNETDRGRNLVGGQAVVTDLDDVALEVHPLATGVAPVAVLPQHHVIRLEPTGDRSIPGSPHRPADCPGYAYRGLDI